MRQLLEQALDRLPQDFRIVFVLREVEQLSITETADCLGLQRGDGQNASASRARQASRRLTRRFRREQLQLFEFGGERCDHIVAAVLRQAERRSCGSLDCARRARLRGSHSPRCSSAAHPSRTAKSGNSEVAESQLGPRCARGNSQRSRDLSPRNVRR